MCYREASDEQFEQFCEDMETGAAAEALTEQAQKDLKQVLEQLDEQKDKEPEERSRVSATHSS